MTPRRFRLTTFETRSRTKTFACAEARKQPKGKMKNALRWLVLVLVMTAIGFSSKTRAAATTPRWEPSSITGVQSLYFTGDVSPDSIDFYVDTAWAFGSGATVYWDLYRPDADHALNPEWYSFQLSWSGANWPMTVVGEGTGQYTYTNYTWYFDSDNFTDPVWIWPLQWGVYLGSGWAGFSPNQYCSTYEYPISSWNGRPGTGSLQRDCSSSWRLWTGGEEGSSGLSFFLVHANAYDLTYQSNIPPTLISVAGQQCDTNGIVYFSAADNQWIGCTPEVAATAQYSFGVTNAKAKLKISRGGDITDKTNTVVVGERISLTCGFDNSTIAPITNFLWAVPGTIVSNYITTSTNGFVVTHQNPQDYTNSSMNFNWIDGSGSSLFEVQCTAKAKGVTLTAKTKFKVIRPTANLNSVFLEDVGIDVFDLTGAIMLNFGLIASTNPGIRFHATNMAPSEVATNGAWFFAQTDEAMIKFNHLDGYSVSYITNGLDKGFPYPTVQTITSPGFSIVTEDSPANVLDTTWAKLWRDDFFTMYLMFSNKSSGSIPIPIKQTEWFWSAVCTNVNGVWDSGSLVNSAFGSTTATSFSLPLWNHRIQNIHWVTNANWIP